MADLAPLLAALEGLGVIAPDLVASEIRGTVASLQARHRTCQKCGRDYVAKSITPRSRFCARACQKGAKRRNMRPVS